MQSDVTVDNTNLKITGTLNFISGGLAESGPLAGDGYFMALEFDDYPEDTVSIKVGMYPSYGSGLVEAINDPDKNGVFKVHDTSQKFAVECTSDEGETVIKYYDLSGLSLVD